MSARALIWALPLTLACGDDPALSPAGSLAPSAQADPAGDGPTLAHDPDTAPNRRSRRRMNIDQLQASMAAISGGVQWSESDASGDTVLLFEQLRGSLGAPDFLGSTDEDLSPGLLFQKFLDDAAQNTCETWVDQEWNASAGDRLLVVEADLDATVASDPDAIHDNLRYLLLRFHGRDVSADANVLGRWATLHQAASDAGDGPRTGWRAVCVAMFVHPDFYSY